MNSVQTDTSSSEPAAVSRAGGVTLGLSRPLSDPVGSKTSGPLGKPRVKLLTTAGDLTPAGASFNPPTPAPLPERGAGLHLFLSVCAALTALVFLVLLAQKL